MVKRYDCLKFLSDQIKDELVVATLAGTTHEWNSLNKREANLYLMGMGLVTGTALGLALALPNRKVVALESDGGMLMSLSILPVVAQQRPSNLTIFCFDNECYYATGGFPSATADVSDLGGLAKAAGIKAAQTVTTLEEFIAAAKESMSREGPNVVIVKTEKGVEKVPAPTMHGIENKYRFARYIERTEKIDIFAPVKS
ncbi:MAG: thiamine pyrophosphate-dependent enzyme [Thermodesulfobacteriota bacterium]